MTCNPKIYMERGFDPLSYYVRCDPCNWTSRSTTDYGELLKFRMAHLTSRVPLDTRPTREETLMEMARAAAKRSTCSRRNVGAVIARDFRPISTGYNGAPSGMPHCNHRLDELALAGCQVVVHAEANAVAFAARYGVSTQGASLFVTLSPCETCAKLVINAGLKEVFYAETYRDQTGLDLLANAGVKTCKI